MMDKNPVVQNNTIATVDKTYRPVKLDRVLLLYPFAVPNAYDLERTLKYGSFIEAPIGLGYISAYIQSQISNLKVEVFDANAMAIKHILETRQCDMANLWNLLKEKLDKFQPDFVGVSCLFHSIAHTAHQTCALVKEISPNIITVMGGNYPAGSPDVVLADDNVDFIIISEGEKSCTKLLETLRLGCSPAGLVDGLKYQQTKIEKILNISSCHPSTEKQGIVFTSNAKFPPNLDDYPWPDRSTFDMEFYATQARHFAYRTLDRDKIRIATLTATRGCPFKCTFCSSKEFWGQQIRYRAPSNVVAEMKFLADKYDINTFILNDDNVMFNRRNILELCDEMSRANLKVNWLSGGGIQVSSMKPDVVAALVATGFKQFNLAIESGSKRTLKKIKKPLNIGVAEEVIDIIRGYEGTWIGSNFVTGFYFQTLDEIRQDLEYAGGLDLDWRGIFEFIALPGSEDYNTCVKKGYIKDWTISEARDGVDAQPLSTENFTYAEVQNLNYIANLRYNFLHNRNLEKNPQQALRDFNYVIEMVPDHAIAHYASGLAHTQLRQYEFAEKSFMQASDLVEESKKIEKSTFEASMALISAQIRWIDLFDKFDIDPKKRLAELVTHHMVRGQVD